MFFIDTFLAQEPHARTIHYSKSPYLSTRILKPPRTTLPSKHHTLCIFITSYHKNLPTISTLPPSLLHLDPLNQPHSLIRNVLTDPPTPQYHPLVLENLLRSLPPPQPHLLFLTEYRIASIHIVGAAVAIMIVAAPAIAETIAGVLGCCCWVG